jgi:hypothetical protein
MLQEPSRYLEGWSSSSKRASHSPPKSWHRWRMGGGAEGGGGKEERDHVRKLSIDGSPCFTSRLRLPLPSSRVLLWGRVPYHRLSSSTVTSRSPCGSSWPKFRVGRKLVRREYSVGFIALRWAVSCSPLAGDGEVNETRRVLWAPQSSDPEQHHGLHGAARPQRPPPRAAHLVVRSTARQQPAGPNRQPRSRAAFTLGVNPPYKNSGPRRGGGCEKRSRLTGRPPARRPVSLGAVPLLGAENPASRSLLKPLV